jgi:prepilin-type N-terminal cleavage/methylation domain-containing protein
MKAVLLPSRRSAQARLGFTLLESIVAAAILSILTLMALPLARVTIQRERERQLRRALWEIRDAIDKYEMAGERGGFSDQGRLVAVDCSQAPAAILTVTAGGAALKHRAADYKSLVLIRTDGFSCDWKDRQVTVNYKPGGSSNGDVVSLEMR